MKQRNILQNAVVGGIALVFGSAQVVPGAQDHGPIVTSAISIMSGKTDTTTRADSSAAKPSKVSIALNAFQSVVRPLSHSRALADAFNSYFAYKAVHPEDVKKPLLYFVDDGLPSNTPRGYVFDME